MMLNVSNVRKVVMHVKVLQIELNADTDIIKAKVKMKGNVLLSVHHTIALVKIT